MPILPDITTPRELAEHLGVSERALRQKARALGTCRMIGKEMIMLAEDVEAFMEGIKQCPSRSKGEAGSGTTRALLPGKDFGALQERLKKPTPKGSRRKSSTSRGSVVSMDRARG